MKMYFAYIGYEYDYENEDEIVYNIFSELCRNPYLEGVYERDDYYDIYGFLNLETAKEFIKRVRELIPQTKIQEVGLIKCYYCEENIATRFVKFSEVRKEYLCEECYNSF